MIFATSSSAGPWENDRVAMRAEYNLQEEENAVQLKKQLIVTVPFESDSYSGRRRILFGGDDRPNYADRTESQAAIWRDTSAFQFVVKLYDASLSQNPDAGIDSVISYFDALLSADNISTCRETFRIADVSRLETSIALSMLAITCPIRSRLKGERTEYTSKLRALLVSTRGTDMAKRLLAGLE